VALPLAHSGRGRRVIGEKVLAAMGFLAALAEIIRCLDDRR
jgi:hypothetical protein